MVLPIEPSRSGPSQVVVDASAEGQRVDNFLLGRLKGVPRSLVYRILRTGQVRVNSGRVRQDYRLCRGDVIRVPPVRVSGAGEQRLPPAPGVQARIGARILYEDASVLALDKPSGVAVHGGSGVSFGVIEALRALRPDAPFLELVHRLDRDTSGCLLVAKRRSALRRLHFLLRAGQVGKTYLALVRGDWPSPRTVEAPLRKNVLQSGERMVRAGGEGKPAMTRFEPLARSGRATLVRATPVTGRTHQIRVHAAHVGHPIAGDPKYGDPDLNRWLGELGLHRLFLHAHTLRYADPEDGHPVVVTAPLSPDLRAVLSALGLKPDAEATGI